MPEDCCTSRQSGEMAAFSMVFSLKDLGELPLHYGVMEQAKPGNRALLDAGAGQQFYRTAFIRIKFFQGRDSPQSGSN